MKSSRKKQTYDTFDDILKYQQGYDHTSCEFTYGGKGDRLSQISQYKLPNGYFGCRILDHKTQLFSYGVCKNNPDQKSGLITILLNELFNQLMDAEEVCTKSEKHGLNSVPDLIE